MVYSYKQVNEAAKGRWADILSRIGFSSIHLNGKSGPCPHCSTGDGNRFQFTDICKAQKTEGLIGWAYCRGCESGSGKSGSGKMTEAEMMTATNVESLEKREKRPAKDKKNNKPRTAR